MSKFNTVSGYAHHRGISEVLHFSTNLGLTGCLHKSYLLPRNKLRTDQQLSHILTLNAPFRAEEADWFDKSQNWINYVNMSLTEITSNLFRHSSRWHADDDIFWVILSFSTKILDDDGVFFASTNNIYPFVKRGTGIDGFGRLFDTLVPRKTGWTATRGDRAKNLPTCEQAEVLYPDGVSMDNLRVVYVREPEEKDRVSALLSHFERDRVQVIISPAKFLGQP